MNREIKFRCWNVEEKIMHDIAFPSWNGAVEVWENNVPQSKVQYLSQNGPALHGILMQFTGRKDKNGKEIYEGDIVRAKWGGIGSVVFDDGGFVSRWEDGNTTYRLCESDIALRELEVIGNIYENPELLK